jgi:hypothetical protein
VSLPDDTEWLLVRNYHAVFFEVAEPSIEEGFQFSEMMDISEEENIASRWTRLQDILDFLKNIGIDHDDLMVSFYSAHH